MHGGSYRHPVRGFVTWSPNRDGSPCAEQSSHQSSTSGTLQDYGHKEKRHKNWAGPLFHRQWGMRHTRVYNIQSEVPDVLSKTVHWRVIAKSTSVISLFRLLYPLF